MHFVLAIETNLLADSTLLSGAHCAGQGHAAWGSNPVPPPHTVCSTSQSSAAGNMPLCPPVTMSAFIMTSDVNLHFSVVFS